MQLLLPPEQKSLCDTLAAAARAAGFAYREPTPLVSPFWHTSLTPSSSEVMYRELAAVAAEGKGFPAKIYTVQPCVRFADLSPHFDGVHILYFHMFTCFVIGCENPLDEVRWFIKSLKASGTPLDRTGFSHFAGNPALVSAPINVDFGRKLIRSLGIAEEGIFPVSGLSNYQLDLHLDETGNEIKVHGPKIELFDREIGQEYGTWIHSKGEWPGKTEEIPPTLSMVVGLERLQLSRDRMFSIWDRQDLHEVRESLVKRLGGTAGEWHPFRKDVELLVVLMLALFGVSANAPDLKPGDKGVRNQLWRIVRAARKCANDIGVELDVILEEMAKLDWVRQVARENSEEIAAWFER